MATVIRGPGLRPDFPTAPLLSAASLRPPAGGSAFRLVASDDTGLRAAYWPDGRRGTAVLLQGRTEFIEKHAEPIGRLLGLGFAVATLDWRGQGLSDRLLPDKRKGHIRRFAEFQLDLDALMGALVALDAPRPFVIVGHSMGGAIAARALMRLESVHAPNWRAAAAVLSAPFLGLAGSGGYLAATRTAAAGASAFGLSASYAPGGSEKPYIEQGYEKNLLTSDRRRFEAIATFVAQHPTIALGGATWGWLRAAFAEQAALRPSRLPTLALVGDQEKVVSIPAIERYVRRAPNATLVKLPGARHEPFIETDAIQERVWRSISSFLDGLSL